MRLEWRAQRPNDKVNLKEVNQVNDNAEASGEIIDHNKGDTSVLNNLKNADKDLGRSSGDQAVAGEGKLGKKILFEQ